MNQMAWRSLLRTTKGATALEANGFWSMPHPIYETS